MASDNAGLASEVRKEAFITAIYCLTRNTFTAGKAVRTLCGSKIATTSTTCHLV
jgi:hypothetical protein